MNKMRVPKSLIPPIGTTLTITSECEKCSDTVTSEEGSPEGEHLNTSTFEKISVEDTSQAELDFEVKLLCDKFTSKQLKEKCREKGFLLGGTKMDLASRLACA